MVGPDGHREWGWLSGREAGSSTSYQGTRVLPPMPWGRLSRKCITWTAPACGRISAHLEQKGEGDQALGRSRGGFGTKIHLRVEGRGKPVALVLTPGQRHEASVFEELMTQGGETLRAWPSPY